MGTLQSEDMAILSLVTKLQFIFGGTFSENFYHAQHREKSRIPTGR